MTARYLLKLVAAYLAFLVAAAAFVLLAEVLAASGAAGEPAGARVIDGDTLRVNGERVRLAGMDAPERRQTCQRSNGAVYGCGIEASRHLRRLIGGYRVACEGLARDRYGRMVAVCRAGAIDLGRRMVADGWAVDAARYRPNYATEEAAARAARRGLHAGRFVPPAAWRRGRR